MKILTSILMSIMMFMMSFTQIEAYNSTWTNDPSEAQRYLTSLHIDMTYSTSGTSGTYTHFLTQPFTVYNNANLLYDVDGSGPMGNGGIPEGHYIINSGVNPRYQYLYIGSLEFDVWNYYYEFELAFTTNGFTLYWEGNGTNDGNYENLSGNDIDVDYSTRDMDDIWLYVYDEVYSQNFTYDAGVEDGFINGYNEARSDYAIYDSSNDTWIDAVDWGQIRYQDGLGMGEGEALSLQNMIPGVLGVFIAFFFQVMSISVLGVSILDIIALMFGVAVVLLLFKTFIK